MLEPVSTPILEIQNLEVSYGAVQVLWGISLSVQKGQVVCLIGSNGAGKTTTLNAIIGVLRARRGRIMALFLTAIPMASIFGGPLSGSILSVVSGAQGFSAVGAVPVGRWLRP